MIEHEDAPKCAEFRVAVVGLGYVGLPLAVALGTRFQHVIGLDINTLRVDEVAAGVDRTGEVSAEALAAAGLTVTTDVNALRDVFIFIIAVPTPLGPGKTPDLSAVEAAARAVGQVIRPGAIVVLESTVWPGVTEEIVGPLIAAASGLELGRGFTVAYSPERVNPGDAVHALTCVPKVVAVNDESTWDRLHKLYGGVVPEVIRAPSIRAAELAKLVENTQRDLNIALMNEVALICDRLHLPTRDVLGVARTKWNFLPFEPGLVGGHCISVDPYFLTQRAQEVGIHPEVILAGRRINDEMARFIAVKTVKLLAECGKASVGARVAVLGVAFKEDFGDVRNSQVAPLMDELEAFGCSVLACDPVVDPDDALVTFGRVLATWDELSAEAPVDAVILAVRHSAFVQAPERVRALLGDEGVLVDVKSALGPEWVGPDGLYWAL